MAVYALAFIAYAFDLATRSTPAPATAERELVGAASVGRVAAKPRIEASRVDSAGLDTPASRATRPTGNRSGKFVAIGTSLTVIAWALHVTADVLRGLAAGRVPFANMYEFALTGTLMITTVYLIVVFAVRQYDLRFLGTFITGLVLVFLGVATVNFYVPISPLPPALQSVWLVIHIFVATSAVGLLALGFALSIVQLLQSHREVLLAEGKAVKLRFLASLPNAETLENLAYRLNVVGFIFWTFTLIAGAVWAERAWGRYWGWDTKEVWTFIIWVVYAGYIHARATRGWRGSRSSWLAIIGFTTVLFNFTVVNLFFKGLHAYSGL
ncbi:c-type cytochrome biogenesis protein CcsB [Agromyces seonyuensis]|uniref:C-type cytochrome biogenesis protein CcsB n=1 Tax=Agromyces seonyuensis TaxID=2662446 RepID=A0A6I4NY39_9MICO|nr:c-type cytochrome biogenesis protein CcsB [Agromyces seonyuensis]MWB98072.1 c-type cytochrome biogenesis protein CcsB [Agromyces seonyuensis]